MSFLFDEQITPRIPNALRELGKPVTHVYDMPGLGRGAKDHEILPYCGENQLCLVSLDRGMVGSPHHTPHLYQLIQGCGVGAFYVSSQRTKQNVTPWEILKIVVRHWEEMERIAASEARPFIKLLKPTGGVVKWGWKAIRNPRR